MYQSLGLSYTPQPSALVDITNIGRDKSQYHTEPHSIIVYWLLRTYCELHTFILCACASSYQPGFCTLHTYHYSLVSV